MLRRGKRRTTGTDDDLSWVYGAAIRAASGEETAARATVAAIGAQRAGGAMRTGRRELMVAAVPERPARSAAGGRARVDRPRADPGPRRERGGGGAPSRRARRQGAAAQGAHPAGEPRAGLGAQVAR